MPRVFLKLWGILQKNLRNICPFSFPFFYFFALRTSNPTVCVTCAGVGTAKPSSQKNDKVCKTAWDVRRIPSVRCTLCWAFLTCVRLTIERLFELIINHLDDIVSKELHFLLQVSRQCNYEYGDEREEFQTWVLGLSNYLSLKKQYD